MLNSTSLTRLLYRLCASPRFAVSVSHFLTDTCKHKSVGEGVQEIVLDYGPGYRIYFGEHGATLVIMLCGSTKKKQEEAIKQAKRYWKDWKERTLR